MTYKIKLFVKTAKGLSVSKYLGAYGIVEVEISDSNGRFESGVAGGIIKAAPTSQTLFDADDKPISVQLPSQQVFALDGWEYGKLYTNRSNYVDVSYRFDNTRPNKPPRTVSGIVTIFGKGFAALLFKTVTIEFIGTLEAIQ